MIQKIMKTVYTNLQFVLLIFIVKSGSDMRSRSRDEEEEEQLKRRQLQEDHLSKVMGHLKAVTENDKDGKYCAKFDRTLVSFR